MSTEHEEPTSDIALASLDDVTSAGIPGHGGGTLFPFRAGDERTRTLARRGVAAREAKRAVVRADTQAAAAHLRTLVATHDRADLGPAAAAVALDVLARLSRGEIPIRNGDEAASLVRALVDVVRLEAGESTSNTLVAHYSGEPLERFRALQAEARELLGRGELARAAGVEHEDGDG